MHTIVMRRRIGRLIQPLAEYFDVELAGDDDEDNTINWLSRVLARAEHAALSDEHSLAHALIRIDSRFDEHWPSDDKVAALQRKLNEELGELHRAIEDWRLRPELREHVVEEIGDMMLVLGRLALTMGCESAMEPLGVAIKKTLARLRHFEQLASSPNADHFNRRDLWKMAKGMARS